MSVELGGVGVRLHCKASLVWTFVGPMSFLAAKVASVIALVTQLGSGLALLKALDKGMDFGLGDGRRQFIGVLDVHGRRSLTHTLVFLVPGFGKVTNISIGKSFAAEVGHFSSMLHESNFLEFIFQGSLIVIRKWQYISSPLARRKVEMMLDLTWWSQTPDVVRAWQW